MDSLNQQSSYLDQLRSKEINNHDQIAYLQQRQRKFPCL